MPSHGLKFAKSHAIKLLKSGHFTNDTRKDVDLKNFFSTGAINKEILTKIIKSSCVDCHKSSPHHSDPTTKVHILTCSDWYIKFYFEESENTPKRVHFISIHPREP
jgi:ribosomal protein S27E